MEASSFFPLPLLDLLLISCQFITELLDIIDYLELSAREASGGHIPFNRGTCRHGPPTRVADTAGRRTPRKANTCLHKRQLSPALRDEPVAGYVLRINVQVFGPSGYVYTVMSSLCM